MDGRRQARKNYMLVLGIDEPLVPHFRIPFQHEEGLE